MKYVHIFYQPILLASSLGIGYLVIYNFWLTIVIWGLFCCLTRYPFTAGVGVAIGFATSYMRQLEFMRQPLIPSEYVFVPPHFYIILLHIFSIAVYFGVLIFVVMCVKRYYNHACWNHITQDFIVAILLAIVTAASLFHVTHRSSLQLQSANDPLNSYKGVLALYEQVILKEDSAAYLLIRLIAEKENSSPHGQLASWCVRDFKHVTAHSSYIQRYERVVIVYDKLGMME